MVWTCDADDSGDVEKKKEVNYHEEDIEPVGWTKLERT